MTRVLEIIAQTYRNFRDNNNGSIPHFILINTDLLHQYFYEERNYYGDPKDGHKFRNVRFVECINVPEDFCVAVGAHIQSEPVTLVDYKEVPYKRITGKL
jgi:hypothetical protein